MKYSFVVDTFVFTLLCCTHFVITNNTGVERNIATSNKTSSNVSKKIEVLDDNYNNDNTLEPSIDDMMKDDLEKYKEKIADTPLENSDKSENILGSDTPVILTLAESSTIELESLVDTSLVSKSIKDDNIPNNISKQVGKSVEIVDTNTTNDNEIQNKTLLVEDLEIAQAKKNISEDKNEEIPSFSEWAQKRLEEVEKSEQINSSSKGQTVNGKTATAKLRWKNYASLDCGAKVIAANPESVSPGAILSPSSDEYKLNTCTTRIWFVVELCEAIQAKRIDLANYELFSSSPKDFVVSVSDRYPTRDWSVVGKFTAKDERDIQSFDLDTHIFGKYIKVEIKSHYGSEHYCPISLFRAYGTSVFEVLQKEDPGNVNPSDDDDDDDDDDDHIVNSNDDHDDSQKNLFSSATDAVMSIVKKAAEVLGNKVNNRTSQSKNGVVNSSTVAKSCSTPSYTIFCNNCSDVFFEQVYDVVSCESSHVKKLAEARLVNEAVSKSWLCESFGYDVDKSLRTSNGVDLFSDYVTSFFSYKYVNAMCLEISILQNRAVWNVSFQFTNKTDGTTEDIVNLKIQDSYMPESEQLKANNFNRTQPLQVLNVTAINLNTSRSSSEENVVNTSLIKPTKTLNSKGNVVQTDMVDANDTSEEYTEPNVPREVVETVSTESFLDSTVEATSEMEGMDNLEDHLEEHLISDFNSENNQHVPVSTATTTNTPQAQKESVFLRLSNRIKVLERNMSLSSQYLEELSRRYKKQVEEMQHLLEKTIVTLHEESQKKDLRNKQLEDRLDHLTAAMESLVAERHNWMLLMYSLLTGSIILLGIYFFCCKRTAHPGTSRENKETHEILRRKSIDIVTHSVPVKKKRRPSDQALKIVRCSVQSDEDKHKNLRQRKRKKRNLIRSNSIGHIKEDSYLSRERKSDAATVADWIENSHKAIEDVPFALEESDQTTLEPYPLENDLMIDVPSTPITETNKYTGLNNGSRNVSQEEGSSISSDKSYLNDKTGNGSLDRVKKEKRSFKRLFKKVF